MTRPRISAANLAFAVRPLRGEPSDFDELIERIGNARFVLMGEASHGTHEFYRERARLTRRLVEEQGFTAVAVEADWPDALRVNRFVNGDGEDTTAEDALGDFQRFPRWMWRNEDVRDFMAWLRDHNGRASTKVGFYGLDLYSLHRSMDAVVDYLENVDADAARRARQRYACFDHFGEDPQQYGLHTGYGGAEPCEDEVIAQLLELQRREQEFVERGGDPDEHFFAQQNARLALDAERYYRATFRGRENTWNLRDQHMFDTLRALEEHLQGRGDAAKVVVWAHNSHIGDARATEMSSRRGELNVGQLVREYAPNETFIVGFGTYTGTVTAADDWGGAARTMRVRPGLQGSVEALLHDSITDDTSPNYWVDLRSDAAEALREDRLQRFIGVIYAPRTERWSHYLSSRPAEQYDALLYFDETTAVEPLDARSGVEEEDEYPDTFPSGQ